MSSAFKQRACVQVAPLILFAVAALSADKETVIRGSVSLQVVTPQQFVTDSAALDAVKKGIATLAAVEKEYARLHASVVGGTRRLGDFGIEEEFPATERQLAAGNVLVNLEIFTPESDIEATNRAKAGDIQASLTAETAVGTLNALFAADTAISDYGVQVEGIMDVSTSQEGGDPVVAGAKNNNQDSEVAAIFIGSITGFLVSGIVVAMGVFCVRRRQEKKITEVKVSNNSRPLD